MLWKDWHNDNEIRNKNISHSLHNKSADVAASDLLSSYNTSHKSPFFSCFITILSIVATPQDPIFSDSPPYADGKALFYKHFPTISLGLDETYTSEHLKVQHFVQDLQQVPTWKLSLQGFLYLKHRFPRLPTGSYKHIWPRSSALPKLIRFTRAWEVPQMPQLWSHKEETLNHLTTTLEHLCV